MDPLKCWPAWEICISLQGFWTGLLPDIVEDIGVDAGDSRDEDDGDEAFAEADEEEALFWVWWEGLHFKQSAWVQMEDHFL